MKRAFASLTASILLIAALALPAAAADLSDPDTLLPVDIILNQEAFEIRKVYDLSPTTDPSTLPREAFDREGYHYECSDILREVVIGAETQKITQTETVESDNKNMETILELLPLEKAVTTEDGFEGTLYLKTDSIQTEPSGYGSKTSPITVTRNYPNLASADTSHLPKSITEGGRTLNLQNVQWQTDNTYNANDYEIGDRFTAICTYGGSKTVSYVKGYTTTADYTSEAPAQGSALIRVGSVKGSTLKEGITSALIISPSCSDYTVTSSNPTVANVAEVLGHWTVNTKAPGTAIIKATAPNGQTGSVTITVESADPSSGNTGSGANLNTNMDIRLEKTMIDPACDCIGVGVTQYDGITYCFMFVGIPNSVNFYA